MLVSSRGCFLPPRCAFAFLASIIVGVGDADFSSMEELDGDGPNKLSARINGVQVTCKRDIVQCKARHGTEQKCSGGGEGRVAEGCFSSWFGYRRNLDMLLTICCSLLENTQLFRSTRWPGTAPPRWPVKCCVRCLSSCRLTCAPRASCPTRSDRPRRMRPSMVATTRSLRRPLLAGLRVPGGESANLISAGTFEARAVP